MTPSLPTPSDCPPPYLQPTTAHHHSRLEYVPLLTRLSLTGPHHFPRALVWCITHPVPLLVQVVPVLPDGRLEDAFDAKLEDLNVIDMTFLAACATPTVALICKV